MNDADLKTRAALASVATSAALAIGKLAAGLLSGSLALISDAGHAGLDTIAATATVFAVRLADKPADEEHHYGHAKVEAIVALAETALLFLLAFVVSEEAVRRLWLSLVQPISDDRLAIAVLLVSILMDFLRWRGLRAVAASTSSRALAADALHFSSDCIGSSLVLVGLLSQRFGFAQGDAVAALAVACFIGLAGARLVKRTVDDLLDAAPRGATQILRDAIAAVPGVVGVDALRLRPSGARVLGEVELSVPRTMPIETAEGVRLEVAKAITKAVPGADLTIAATPRALEDETSSERILLIAARRGLPVHHISVQDIDGRKFVSLDVELDAQMPLGAAHEIASRLEGEIAAELGDVDVETHIEPLDIEERPSVAAAAATSASIAFDLSAIAAAEGALDEIHDVRVRSTDQGLIVNYHCRIDPTLSVENAHAHVDRLDHLIRRRFPEIIRIVGHAEPASR